MDCSMLLGFTLPVLSEYSLMGFGADGGIGCGLVPTVTEYSQYG